MKATKTKTTEIRTTRTKNYKKEIEAKDYNYKRNENHKQLIATSLILHTKNYTLKTTKLGTTKARNYKSKTTKTKSYETKSYKNQILQRLKTIKVKIHKN